MTLENKQGWLIETLGNISNADLRKIYDEACLFVRKDIPLRSVEALKLQEEVKKNINTFDENYAKGAWKFIIDAILLEAARRFLCHPEML